MTRGNTWSSRRLRIHPEQPSHTTASAVCAPVRSLGEAEDMAEVANASTCGQGVVRVRRVGCQADKLDNGMQLHAAAMPHTN
jgi:hypothetical protein